jgi:DNA mismatch repair protein MutS2
MDEKTLQILEYPKILERLARYCAFPASIEKAHNIQPTDDIFEARRRLAETSEAVQLLVTHSDLTIGGARDVRGPVDLAQHGGVLLPTDLLDIKYTLVSARNLWRTFERLAEKFPHLYDIAVQIPSPPGIIDAITRAISDHGEILDSASDKLSNIRHDLRIVHDRLLTKMQHMVTDPRNTPFLQEALVTQRDGRYVLPLRAEFKGRIKSIVHDQSSSGATLFVEPLVVVELNNQYRGLQLAERDEERRILTELSNQVGLAAFEIAHTVEVIAELDLALARARFAEDMRASMPILHEIPETDHRRMNTHQQRMATGQPGDASEPSESSVVRDRHPGTVIRLYQACHPLLDPTNVVPIDVELDQKTYAVVITGPNTGGKTVTLKTVGLLVLMAQSGLHIPVQSGSEISLFETVYADIGDEQSIEQSLSTFSGHVTNIIHILEQADSHSLVILDELGAGTDPQEGAALARSILNHLLERGITTLVTTHHPELKVYAHSTPGVANACVEFDLVTLQPTFHLTIGLPGRSNALAIAQRLGLPKPIIEAARHELNPDDIRADSLLSEIHYQRELARQARSVVEKDRREAEGLRAELADRLDKIEDERYALLEEARQEAAGQLQALQEEMAEARRQLSRARQPTITIEEVEEKIETLQETIEQPVQKSRLTESMVVSEIAGPIGIGDRVFLRRLGVQGVVTGITNEDAEVQVGIMRVRARLEDVERSNASQKSTATNDLAIRKQKPIQIESNKTKSAIELSASPGIELDLRGKRADDALDDLDRYLDAAYVAGLPFVRIIHGKGTGRLREVVRQALSDHPNVRSFESGGEKEGGDGVTVAKLATS